MKRYLLFSILMLFVSLVFAQQNDSFRDSRDGEVYKIVVIGKQVWMAENLRFIPHNNTNSKELNSDIKNNIKKLLDSENLREYRGARLYRCLIEASVNERYGYFYHYTETTDACPNGWHIPTNKDFEQLLNTLEKDGYSGKGIICGLVDTKYSYGIIQHCRIRHEFMNHYGFDAVLTGYATVGNKEHYMNGGGLLTGFWGINSILFVGGGEDNKSLLKVELNEHDFRDFFPIRCIKD